MLKSDGFQIMGWLLPPQRGSGWVLSTVCVWVCEDSKGRLWGRPPLLAELMRILSHNKIARPSKETEQGELLPWTQQNFIQVHREAGRIGLWTAGSWSKLLCPVCVTNPWTDHHREESLKFHHHLMLVAAHTNPVIMLRQAASMI